jgi:mannose-6-phosphate isomerase-like protein (cupin superfamily)
MENTDYGKKPYVVNVEELTVANTNYRTTVWTGVNLQMTLMSIPVGGEVGLEAHPDNDQFLRIEQGKAKVQMGPSQDNLDFAQDAEAEYAIFVPANTWHNITNTGDVELKIYSIYAPPHHKPGTVHPTFGDDPDHKI